MTQKTRTTVKDGGRPDGPNLVVHVSEGSVNLDINRARIFETLANRLAILALVQRRLEELLQQYMDRFAAAERRRNAEALEVHGKRHVGDAR